MGAPWLNLLRASHWKLSVPDKCSGRVCTSAHSNLRTISATSAFMAGVLPAELRMACRAAVASIWMRHNARPFNLGSQTSIANSAASSSHSACQAGSPRTARRKLQSVSVQSPAIQQIGHTNSNKTAPKPNGEASVRMASRSTAALEDTSTHRLMDDDLVDEASNPPRRNWIHRRACAIRMMQKSWVGRFLAENFST